ncbi:MAG: hypothetical protein GXP62_03655 [Oligoflexia bacterium]|nr:hypothetical protein [Oligoflexia bacterium]
MTVPPPDDGDAFVRTLAAAMARALLDPGLRDRCRAVAQTLPDDGAFEQLTRLALTLHP